MYGNTQFLLTTYLFLIDHASSGFPPLAVKIPSKKSHSLKCFLGSTRTKHLTHITSGNSHQHPVRRVLLLSPFYRQAKWGVESAGAGGPLLSGRAELSVGAGTGTPSGPLLRNVYTPLLSESCFLKENYRQLGHTPPSLSFQLRSRVEI